MFSLMRRFLRKLGINNKLGGRKNRQIDPVTGLHGEHIGCTEGASGTWQQILTGEEARLITKRYQGWLLYEGYLKDD